MGLISFFFFFSISLFLSFFLSFIESPSSSIWIGEGGGAYNSGRDNVTNSFNSGFWYLDQMAIFATLVRTVRCIYRPFTLCASISLLLLALSFEQLQKACFCSVKLPFFFLSDLLC